MNQGQGPQTPETWRRKLRDILSAARNAIITWSPVIGTLALLLTVIVGLAIRVHDLDVSISNIEKKVEKLEKLESKLDEISTALQRLKDSVDQRDKPFASTDRVQVVGFPPQGWKIKAALIDPKEHGQPSSCGIAYDRSQFVVLLSGSLADQSPCGSILTVVNLRTGLSVRAKVIGKFPDFPKDKLRLMLVSDAAASGLSFTLEEGVIEVFVETVSVGKP